MKRNMLIGCCVLLLTTAAGGAQFDTAGALRGVKRVKFVVDVNVGEPALLLKRMALLDATIRQLTEAGTKPIVVVAFRGKASRFITKGKGYVEDDQQDAKLAMRGWIERFSGRGIIIEQCALAAEILEIGLDDFLPQVTVVQNGYVSLIGYQHQGYAFLPMD